MAYSYPVDFPQSSCAAVERTKIQARLELDDSKERLRRLSDLETEVRKYILRVFAAFVREALTLGQQNLWTVDRVQTQVSEFLSCLVVEAQYQNGRDQWGTPISPLVDRVFGRILPEVQREFERSDEWRHYQRGLIAVAEAQASTPQPEASGQVHADAVGKVRDTSRGFPKRSATPKSKGARRTPPNEDIDRALREVSDSRPKGVIASLK